MSPERGTFFVAPEGVCRRHRGDRARRTRFCHPERGDTSFAPARAQTAPQARNLSAIAPQCRFLQRRCNCAFGDHIFSLLREKIWKKRALENEIALTRRKTSRYTLRIIVTPVVQERPDGRP